MRLDRADGPECPQCGCQESRLLASRQSAWVCTDPRYGDLSATFETRRCTGCGARFRAKSEIENCQLTIENSEHDSEQAVIYRPVRCPACKSKQTKISTTRDRIRYHKCRDCGQTFKSVEEAE